ncbi:MAG: SecY-interacting protein Syd [Polyangiales bacterium]
MRLPIHASLRSLLERYIDAVRAVSGHLPVTDADPDNPSPCEVGVADGDDVVTWRPARREIAPDFRPLEAALGAPLHEDLQVWFGAWWCFPFEAQLGGETFVLSLIGSPGDWDRARESLQRHAEAQAALGEELTVPVAALYDGRYIAVHNRTGEVILDGPRREPLRLAPSLAAWIDRLTPVPL